MPQISVKPILPNNSSGLGFVVSVVWWVRISPPPCPWLSSVYKSNARCIKPLQKAPTTKINTDRVVSHPLTRGNGWFKDLSKAIRSRDRCG